MRKKRSPVAALALAALVVAGGAWYALRPANLTMGDVATALRSAGLLKPDKFLPHDRDVGWYFICDDPDRAEFDEWESASVASEHAKEWKALYNDTVYVNRNLTLEFTGKGKGPEARKVLKAFQGIR